MFVLRVCAACITVGNVYFAFPVRRVAELLMPHTVRTKPCVYGTIYRLYTCSDQRVITTTNPSHLTS